eukprot:13881189-Ditylum_brightwellii.AAC.1
MAAFVQSVIDSLVYVHQSKGWQCLGKIRIPMLFKEGYVLKLNKCLYSLRQAPNNFFWFLEGKLVDCGFCRALMIHASSSATRSSGMKQAGLEFGIKNNTAGLLGINIEC